MGTMHGIEEERPTPPAPRRRPGRSTERSQVTEFLAAFAATVAVAALLVAAFRSGDPRDASSLPTASARSAPASSSIGTPGPAVPSPTLASSAKTTAAPNPGSAHWDAAGRLIGSHGRAALLPLRDGGVVVVGDDNVCSPGAAWESSVYTELGDTSGVWLATGVLPKPRDRFAAAPLIDGRVIVAGGTGLETADAGPRSYSSAYILDAPAWSRTELMVTARSDPAYALLRDGRVLVAGGYYADLPEHPPLRVLSSAESFDPATGTWSRTGSLAAARYGAQAVTLDDGLVLVVGGWAGITDGPAPRYGTHRPVATAELFDPASGLWMAAGSLSAARDGFVLVALPDGGALVAGGRTWWDDGEWSGIKPTASAERFDPSTRRWRPAADMPTAAAFRAAARLENGTILVAGGDLTASEPDIDTAAAFTADVALYDPSTDRWGPTAPLPAPRSDAKALLLDDGSVLLATGFGTPPSGLDTPSCPVADAVVWRYYPR